MRLTRTRAVMLDALAQTACPAIVCEVGRASGPIWREAHGRLSYESDALACQVTTVFDLASLTKVIATTSIVMQHVRAGTLHLDSPVQPLLPEWTDPAYAAVTWGHLLDHSSGLPAHLRHWEQAHDAASLQTRLLQVPLERPVGATSVYSDTGFMVLGCALERKVGAPLDSQWNQLWARDVPWLDFTPPRATWDQIAPTEMDPWRGRVLQGEVHDERAAVLGGVAPHAGLFGAVDAVGVFAATVLQSFNAETWLATPSLMRTFAERRDVPGSSRALGWDTMLPTSSCGTRLSASAIGHTGFTGTSLWIDWQRDLYVVVLTNRVHPTRANERFPPMRAQIHDAVVRDLTEN